MTPPAITSQAPTIHGVECYEAWRAHEDCPHERDADGA